MKTCKVCGEAKRAEQGSWVVAHGKAIGRTCLSCAIIRNHKYRATVAGKAAEARWWKSDKGKLASAKYEASELGKARAAKSGLKYRASGKANMRKLVRYANDQVFRASEIAASSAWAKNNPHKANSIAASRRVKKLQCTPAWLTKEDKALIEAKYAMARWLSEVVGVPYHVDHVLPLKGKLVSGLHVPDNLAVIRAEENMSKKNKYAVL